MERVEKKSRKKEGSAENQCDSDRRPWALHFSRWEVAEKTLHSAVLGQGKQDLKSQFQTLLCNLWEVIASRRREYALGSFLVPRRNSEKLC